MLSLWELRDHWEALASHSCSQLEALSDRWEALVVEGNVAVPQRSLPAPGCLEPFAGQCRED